MDRSASVLATRAEELLRLLAAAMNAVRLYPPASPLRTAGIARFTQGVNEIAGAHGPLQYRIDRNRFLIGDTAIGESAPQVAALAEILHALQVGQLIVAPGVTDEETLRFVDIIGGDTTAVRASGGIRKALLDAAVANIAVIEVTLRASTEAGLLGLDLTTAPIDDIAAELAGVNAAWHDAAAQGLTPADTIAEAIERLEPAARDLAMRRCAEALLHLDEQTRMALVDTALPGTTDTARMKGLLDIVAHVPPAALARLLRLTAEMKGDSAEDILAGIEIPADLADQVAALLKPSPQTDEQRGIPPEADVTGIVAEVASTDEGDILHLDRLVADVTPRAAAARGLDTALQLVLSRPSGEGIRSVADALVPAVNAGAVEQLADASLVLQRFGEDPGLAGEAASARRALADPDLARECARRLANGFDAAPARILLEVAGAEGAEALIMAYAESGDAQRARLLPVLEAMAETVAPTAGKHLRSGDAATAMAAVNMLGAMRSRRLVPTIALGLDHLDATVRRAAIAAIVQVPGTESTQLLEKALAHWDPETRRAAAREIGNARLEEALPALLRVIAVVEVFERNYELKKEVLKSLEMLGSERAIPALERLASRRVVLGKKNRELRYLAGRVLESLRQEARTHRRGMPE